MAIKKAETKSAEARLECFLDAYAPEVAEIARKALMKLRKRLPFATEMVYDNYNALACGFGPSERVSDAIFSIAVYPKHVNFSFCRVRSFLILMVCCRERVLVSVIFVLKTRRRWIERCGSYDGNSDEDGEGVVRRKSGVQAGHQIDFVQAEAATAASGQGEGKEVADRIEE